MIMTLAAGAPAAGAADAPVPPLFSVASLISLLTLTLLEIVLGIDNIVFIAILVKKLPAEMQANARRIGLGLAMGIRILLLLAIGWITTLTWPLFTVPNFWGGTEGLAISWRDIILLTGGLFLVGKATYELHDKLEGDEHHAGGPSRATASFASVITQILLLDIVFSLDSVITAVGVAQHVPIMIAAVVIAVGVMLIFAGPVSDFIDRHPTFKILALSFLILIGVVLIVDGLHAHIPKGYVYFAMAFSVLVELMNMRLRKVSSPVKLHQTYVKPEGEAAPLTTGGST